MFNVIILGLHLPKMKIDEGQLFGMAPYTQLMPALNTWEPQTQVIVSGVHNGIRNMLLYNTDQKFTKYKKYRIPSHNNPFYTRQDDTDNIKRYGGVQSDEYQQLVAAKPGSAALQIIGADTIKRQSYDFYSYRYSNNNKAKGEDYRIAFDRPRLPEGLKEVIAAIDTGFVDPTVINVLGRDNKGIWRTYLRYRMTRIDFPEQEKIIDWLDDVYHFDRIGIDIGAGGNGASIMQGLNTRNEYRDKKYNTRVFGYNNSEGILVGRDDEGKEIKKDAKSVGTEELVKRIEDGYIVFSELDAEGTSELERLGKQKGMNGVDRYFIISDTGKGKSAQDHIYSAYVVFGLMIREYQDTKRKKKLGRSSALNR